MAILRAIRLALLMPLCWLALASFAAAQPVAPSLPQWQHTSINDFAGLLGDDDTRTLDQALIALNRDTGVQGTVVTLSNRARYGGTDGLESFATRLFNYWGVGDRTRNDGFMVLVLPGDHEARIELGAGYPADANRLAAQIMDRVMLPAFREGDYVRGLRDGTLAVIDRIARPHAAGQPVKFTRERGNGPLSGFALFAAIAAGMFGLQRWNQRRSNRCPKCGHQPLTAAGVPLREDMGNGAWREAQQSVTRSCPSCGWQDIPRTVPLPLIGYYDPTGRLLRQERQRDFNRSSGGGFGGGSSSGGGASGRW